MSEVPAQDVLEAPGVRVMPVAGLHRWSIRTPVADRHVYESLLDLQLPPQPLRSFQADHGMALWLGPDEWLVLLQEASALAFAERCSRFDWTAVPPSSLVDVTHRSCGIELSGSSAPWILNSGCPLDLGLDHFTAGTCTRTLFGKAEAVLCRLPGPTPRYYLECWRSFMPYVWQRLRVAISEHIFSSARKA